MENTLPQKKKKHGNCPASEKYRAHAAGWTPLPLDFKKGLEMSISNLKSTLRSLFDPEVEVWIRKGQSPSCTE